MKRDELKTKAELIEELRMLRKHVSELEKVEEALMDYSEKWHSLAETAPIFILTVSYDGTIQFVNRPTGGLTKEQSIGTKIYEYVEPGQCDIMRRSIEKVFKTGKSDSYEILGLGPDGQNSAWYETHLGPIKDKGKVVAVTMVSTDITEHKKAEETIKQNRALIQGILDNTSFIVVVRDIQGRYIMVNKEVEKVLNMESKEIIGKTPDHIHATDHANKILTDDMKVIESRRQLYIEDQLEVQGETRTFLGSKFPLLNSEGEPYAVCTLATDITERNKALQEIDTLAKFPSQNPNPVIRIARDGKVLYANEASSPVLKTWGIKEGEYLAEIDCKRIKETLNTGKVSNFEFICNHGRIFLVTLAPVIDGEYVNFYGTDITEQKRSEKSLAQSELRYRSLWKNVPAGMALATRDGKMLECNNALLDMLGYSDAQIKKIHLKETYVNPTERERLFEKLRADGLVRNFEVQLRRKNGTTCWLSQTVIPFPLLGEQTHLTVAVDITERKKMERELRKSKDLLEKTFLSLDSAIFILDNELPPHIVDCNPAALNIFGYERTQMLGQTTDFLHVNKEVLLEFQEKLFSAIKAQGYLSAFEFRMKRKNGQIFPTEHSVIPLKNDQGDRIGWISVVRDFTKRKKAEEALQQSEERYRLAVEDSPGLLCSFLPDGKIVFVNSAYCKYFGKTREELIGKKFTHLIPEEDRKFVLNNILSLTVDSPIITHEHKVTAPDGRICWQRWTNRALFDDHGRAVSFQSFGEDITKQKHIEQALAESEEKYRTLVESAGDPIVTIDKNGVFLFANRKAAEDSGNQSESMVGMSLWDCFSKETADQQAASIRKVINTGIRMNVVSSIEVQNRSIWYNTTIEPLKDSSGRVYAALVISRNVDEMKRAEERIRILSSAVEQSIDGIALGDEEPKLLYANKAFARMHGYSPEDIIGMTVADFHNDMQVSEYTSGINQIKTQGSWAGEIEHKRKDGTTFPCYVSATLLKNDMGKATGMLAVCRDISEYKRTQEALKIKDAAIASSINAIAIGNVEGNLTYVNNSFVKMWGYDSEDEIIERPAAEFWTVLDQSEVIVEALRTGAGWIGELIAIRKDHSLFDVQVCQTSIRDENDKITSLMASFVDITHSKRDREEISLYREKMIRAERLASLGTISATLAHKLTQPLTVIRLSLDNALDLLGTISSSQTIIKKLNESLTQVSNITSIVDGFRNFARKSSKKTAQEVDLKLVADKILNLLNESANRVKISLKQKDIDKLPSVWMSERDLEQIFFALIMNSIQAADGRKARRLLISGAVKDQHIELCFTDDCGGISPENIEKIFEPFFTTKPLGQGTGLGLCIVQNILSSIGGRIRVNSKFGKTTFTIELPLD